MANTYELKPVVSLLVTNIQAEFIKKATGITTFTCKDGLAIRETIERAIASGKPASFAAKSTGKDKAGNTIAEFIITWSFRSKAIINTRNL